ncbi:MAG TPA: hypothetical protein VKR52_19640 [Terracidiphilus sp.]|nr:hypothetical protein [Terracidiphilus sp.]
MADFPESSLPSPDEQLARTLQRLWPHRKHEGGTWRAFLCLLGLHRWAVPDYTSIATHRSIRFCLSCSTVEIDGVFYR